MTSRASSKQQKILLHYGLILILIIIMEAMHGENPEAELELSRDELDNLTAALKNDQFRDMLNDYAKEVHDPANVKLYQEEVTQLEKERGVQVTFLHPEPGYVIKTSINGERKAFVNLCTNSNVAQPTCERAVDGEGGDCPQQGFRWSLPYSISPPREDLDRAGRRCVVYDVLFHPFVLRMARANPRFQKMVENTAMDGLETHFAIKFDRNNVRHPKLKFKGYPTATVIRQFPKGRQSTESNGFVRYPDPKDSWIERAKRAKEKADKKAAATAKRKTNQSKNDLKDGTTQPKFVLKHRDDVDIQDFTYAPSGQPAAVSRIPKELVVEIDLPLVNSASQVDLDVTEKTLELTSPSPVAYYLHVPLPHEVDSDEAKAKFDVGTRKLTVTLPVKPANRHTYNPLPSAPEERILDENQDLDSALPEAQLGVGSIRVHCSREEKSSKKSIASLVTEVSLEYRTKSDDDDDDDDDDDSAINDRSDSTVIYTPKVPSSTCSLPTYNIRQTKDKLIVVILERNVNPESITKKFEEGDSLCSVLFHSVGSGFVPFHYSLCVACPPGKLFNSDEFNYSVEDESTVLIFDKGAGCHSDWDTVQVGLAQDHLEEVQLVTPANALARLKQLEEEAHVPASTATATQVSVVSHSAEKVEIEIQPNIPEATESLKPEPLLSEESNEPTPAQSADKRKIISLVKSDASSDDASHDENHDAISEVFSDPTWAVSQRLQKPRQKVRSMSESSTDQGRKPKGILKLRHFGRSISESGSDDLSWSSQEIISSPDADIPEESSADEQGLHSKKSVRFNEVVSRTLYRTNSSILGQRKKNQRKQRNKKRASQRRFSESEGSEAETEALPVNNNRSADECSTLVAQPDKETGEEHSFKREDNLNHEVGRNATLRDIDDNVVVNSIADDNANNTNRTIDNDQHKEAAPSVKPANDNSYVRRIDSSELDENDNAQEGASTSGDEGSDWQVVKESKRSRERKKKKKVKADDGRPQTILSWDERRTTEIENKTQCPLEFTNSVMYDLDD